MFSRELQLGSVPKNLFYLEQFAVPYIILFHMKKNVVFSVLFWTIS